MGVAVDGGLLVFVVGCSTEEQSVLPDADHPTNSVDETGVTAAGEAAADDSTR